ncbi:MAG: pyridoxamine 5'-phosphate oxidase family protein [Alphaproteobacteria bacterium]|nr:pyridoxamine 5'-phosphate oxidase family protein [Alphaproteobacteria bacterium]
MDRPFYHEGMRALQDRFDGRRIADVLVEKRLHQEFWDDERALIEQAPCLFIATAHDGYVDCSIKSGAPGFVKIVGLNVLEFPEYDGNSMYRTVGNIAKSPNVGLLFVRFDGTSRRIRINGIATLHDDAETLARHHGAKLVVRVVCELYPNCPRGVPDLITGAPSPYAPRPGYDPPAPEWKSRDYIRDILPRDDPHAATVRNTRD